MESHSGEPAKWNDTHEKFSNDYGASEIRIGLRRFDCIGVSPRRTIIRISTFVPIAPPYSAMTRT